MAWTESKIEVSYLENHLNGTTSVDLDTDAFKASFWNNTITPNNEVSAANAAYGAGQWASGEVTDGTNVPAGGLTIANPTIASAANVITWDADNVSTPADTTLADVYGIKVSRSSDDVGIGFFYLGGVQAVTSGVLTVNWAAAGIASITA